MATLAATAEHVHYNQAMRRRAGGVLLVLGHVQDSKAVASLHECVGARRVVGHAPRRRTVRGVALSMSVSSAAALLVSPYRCWVARLESREDIHIVYFDINGSTQAKRKKRVRQYKDGIRRRIHRAKDIGPVTYYGKPVTPAPNPENPKVRAPVDPLKPESGYYDKPKTGYSYHVIELIDSAGGTGMKVQLLICDYNQYLVAFRRESAGVWSRWYHCSDFYLPDHFQAIKLNIEGDHRIYSTIGGNQCLEDMFYGMATYPEHMDDDRLQKAFLRAVILFCEAIRLRIVYDEMVRRLELIMDAVALTAYMWKQIRNWSSLCDLALECGGKNRGFVDRKTLDILIRDKKMTSFYLLIADERSELMLLMRNEEALPKVKNLTRKVAVRVVDPGFPAPKAGMA
ncbi:hypothetical protein ACQ4PT_042429 [Festuca glaucescens]